MFPETAEEFEVLRQEALWSGYNLTELKSKLMGFSVLSEIHVFAVGYIAERNALEHGFPAAERSTAHFRALHGSSECQHLDMESDGVLTGLRHLWERRSQRHADQA